MMIRCFTHFGFSTKGSTSTTKIYVHRGIVTRLRYRVTITSKRKVEKQARKVLSCQHSLVKTL